MKKDFQTVLLGLIGAGSSFWCAYLADEYLHDIRITATTFMLMLALMNALFIIINLEGKKV